MAELKTRIKQVSSDIPDGNQAVYDVTLMVWKGDHWEPATEENFPADRKLTVTLPYPDGTDSRDSFTVAHMFTSDFGGQTPGAVETFTTPNTAKRTSKGIEVVLTGLSPISVGWVKASGGGGGDGPVITVIPITGVRLTPSARTLKVNESFQLKAEVIPSNTTQSKAVRWSSSNPAVAEVDGKGRVTANAPGTAEITVTTASGGYKAVCKVTVEAVEPPAPPEPPVPPEPEIYTIVYDGNGGSGAMKAGTAAAGEPFVLPECGFDAPEGKEFDVWAIGSVDGERVPAGESCTFREGTIVYAIWKDVPAPRR